VITTRRYTNPRLPLPLGLSYKIIKTFSKQKFQINDSIAFSSNGFISTSDLNACRYAGQQLGNE